MEIGIIGLPQSGKTTVFKALTRRRAEAHEAAPHVGVVKVPDPRLATLSQMLQPQRTVPAEVKYIDFPGGLGGGKGIGGEVLGQAAGADALIHVVRAFAEERVPHVEGSVDPERDMATGDLELVFWDLALIERRLKRLEDSLKGAKPQEREAAGRERAFLERIKAGLEKEVPLRAQSIGGEERKALEGYNFLSVRPLLVLVNIGEEQVPQAGELEANLRGHLRYPNTEMALLCAKLEMELGELAPREAEEFRSALGLEESALERVIRLSYHLLGLITFFTIASGEVKAWAIPGGTTALKAAGKIHSDMEKGFIRAEVIAYQDLMRCGGIAEGRRQGLLRLEGKNYQLEDGDVVTILFHI